jgi:hypothetical protein
MPDVNSPRKAPCHRLRVLKLWKQYLSHNRFALQKPCFKQLNAVVDCAVLGNGFFRKYCAHNLASSVKAAIPSLPAPNKRFNVLA